MFDRAAMPGRLAAFLQERRDDVDDVECVSYEPMAGGYSRVMARARVRYRQGDVTLEETVVLRGDPPPGAAMIETDRQREWSVLASLSGRGDVPTPRALHFDATGEHLGTPTIVMEFVEGGSLQATIEPLDDLAPYVEDMARLWARVHLIEPDELGDLFEAPGSWEDHVDGLVQQWRDMEAEHVNRDPTWRYFAAWLEVHKPEPLPFRLTHGDPQAPNVMVHPDGWRIVDWEFASVGDPREDLGWYNLYSSVAGPNLYAVDPERFLAAYREVTGFPGSAVNQATVGYFSMLGSVKVARTIVQAIDGLARGTNAGTMTAFNINSIMFGHGNFLEAIAGLEAALADAGQAEASA